MRTYTQGYPKPQRHYTEAELIYLTKWAGILPLSLIARVLGRHYASVACKVSSMGLLTGLNEQEFIDSQQRKLRAIEQEIERTAA